MPHLSIDTEDIAIRLHKLATAEPCEECEPWATEAVVDIAALLIQVNRLYLALRKERMRSANLEAAMRAALGAHDDEEADPLDYLRDEIAGNPGGAYGA